MIKIEDIVDIANSYRAMVTEKKAKDDEKVSSGAKEKVESNPKKKKEAASKKLGDVDVSVEEAVSQKGSDETKDTFKKQVGSGRTPKETDMVNDFKNPKTGADAKKANTLNFKTFKAMTKKAKHNGNINPPGDKTIVK